VRENTDRLQGSQAFLKRPFPEAERIEHLPGGVGFAGKKVLVRDRHLQHRNLQPSDEPFYADGNLGIVEQLIEQQSHDIQLHGIHLVHARAQTGPLQFAQYIGRVRATGAMHRRYRDGEVSGPGQLDDYAGQFLYAGKGLGVTAWGMNVERLPAHWDEFPHHDHAENGQEEVYVVIDGDATLHADGQTWHLERGTLARVGPKQKRKIVPGEKGVTLLAIGGTPGKAYEPKKA